MTLHICVCVCVYARAHTHVHVYVCDEPKVAQPLKNMEVFL